MTQAQYARYQLLDNRVKNLIAETEKLKYQLIIWCDVVTDNPEASVLLRKDILMTIENNKKSKIRALQGAMEAV